MRRNCVCVINNVGFTNVTLYSKLTGQAASVSADRKFKVCTPSPLNQQCEVCTIASAVMHTVYVASTSKTNGLDIAAVMHTVYVAFTSKTNGLDIAAVMHTVYVASTSKTNGLDIAAVSVRQCNVCHRWEWLVEISNASTFSQISKKMLECKLRSLSILC